MLVDEHGQRRAPGALARDQPVGPGLDHAADAIAAQRRVEFGGVDGRKGALAQGLAVVQRLIHVDEPLRGVPEDHRRLGAPGVGIGVLDPAAGEEGAGLDQLFDDSVVGRPELARLLALGLQHLQAAEQGHVVVIGPVGVDHLGDLPMAVGQPYLVVLGPVTGSGVDEAGAGVLGDVVAGQQRHGEAVVGIQRGQGMAADHAVALDGLQPPPRGDLGGLAHVVGQTVGDDQPVVGLGPGLEGEPLLHGLDHIDAVGDVGVVGDRPVAGDGPGGGGPDHHAGPASGVGALDHRELHPDRGADVVVVLDLGVGQGRALDRAPHHRL